MGRSTPYFFNDRGAPILLIGAKEFRCIGASPPFDHPHIYLDMGSDAEIVCPYCSTLFRYDAAVGDLDARPVFEPQARQIGPPQLTPAKQNSVALALAGSPGPRTLRRLEKTRIVRVLVWIVRFCAWYSLVVAIEVAIAKLFELIAESGQDWLHAAGEFQKRFVMAVDQLQPWQLYEIYINQPAPVTISQNVSLLLELRRAVHTILQLVTSPNTFVSTLSAIGFAVSLMASWYLVVQRPARTHDAAGSSWASSIRHLLPS